MPAKKSAKPRNQSGAAPQRRCSRCKLKVSEPVLDPPVGYVCKWCLPILTPKQIERYTALFQKVQAEHEEEKRTIERAEQQAMALGIRPPAFREASKADIRVPRKKGKGRRRLNKPVPRTTLEEMEAKAKKEAGDQFTLPPPRSQFTPRSTVVERELAARELARRHLLPFVLRHHPGYDAGWVHKDIARRLERFAQDIRDKKSPRLMLQVPPRHGKSLLASQYFPAWLLGGNPEMEVIACSYASPLALSFSRKVRAVIGEEAFMATFPDCLPDPDNQNAEGWLTTKGGGYLPAGVGGPITGRGAHCLIIDDPVKNSDDAESQTMRESIKAWYQTTAYTRLAPGAGVLVIQTRWHDDDLSGWLESTMKSGEGDTWEIIRYPAVAVEDEEFRKAGEPLHPARYPLDALRRIERAVGPRTWAALYQQNPVPDDGGYFSRNMIRYYDGPPPSRMVRYATWDFAIGKKERNDWTAGIVFGVDEDENIWLLDMRRGRWDSHEIVEQLIDVQRTWRCDSMLLERGHIQMAVGPFLEKRIAEERLYDMVIDDLPPGRRDKSARARAIQGRLKQGKVLFPRSAAWVTVLVDEMLRFPDGQHDDCVDALAYVGLMLADMSAPPAPPAQDADKTRKWRDRLHAFVTRGTRKSAMTA